MTALGTETRPVDTDRSVAGGHVVDDGPLCRLTVELGPGGDIRLRVAGELDIASTDSFARTWAVLATLRPFDLDLSGLSFVDVAGARLLLPALADVGRWGGTVTGRRGPVARTLALLESLDVTWSHPSVPGVTDPEVARSLVLERMAAVAVAVRAVEQRTADQAQRAMLAEAREELRLASSETKHLLRQGVGLPPMS